MLNVVVLMGRLVADPQLRQTPQGINVASFRIAVDQHGLVFCHNLYTSFWTYGPLP